MNAPLRIELIQVDGFHLAEFHAGDGEVPAYTGLNRTKAEATALLRAMLMALVVHFQDDIPALEHIASLLDPGPAAAEPRASADPNLPTGADLAQISLENPPEEAGVCHASGAKSEPVGST